MDRLNTRIIGQRRNREDRAAAEREGVGAAAKSAGDEDARLRGGGSWPARRCSLCSCRPTRYRAAMVAAARWRAMARGGRAVPART